MPDLGLLTPKLSGISCYVTGLDQYITNRKNQEWFFRFFLFGLAISGKKSGANKLSRR